MTLWTWAWSRFPDLVHEDLVGIQETDEVRVTFRDGTEVAGYPDARQSRRGELVLFSRSETGRPWETGPHSLDEIVSVVRVG